MGDRLKIDIQNNSSDKRLVKNYSQLGEEFLSINIDLRRRYARVGLLLTMIQAELKYKLDI